MTSAKIRRKSVTCFPHADNATYSDSPELSVTIVCLFEVHNTGAPFILISVPVVYRLVSWHPAQSASEYATNGSELTFDLG